MGSPGNAQIGKGTVLKTCATMSGSYTAIAGLKDVDDPGKKYDKVETTEYDDAIIQRMPGWLDAGDVKFKLNYTYAQAAAVDALVGVVNQWWKVVKPDGSGYQFQGWISEVGGKNPIKGVIEQDVTITLTSAPTIFVS